MFEYSVDGGANWTDIGAYTGSAGALSATFATVSLDFTAIAGLDNNPNAMFRITYSGATNASGNNRWDNFYVQGTELIPEPSTIGLALASFGCLLIRRK
ncbi:MAG: PEP-CTERM sorting domain-containing protein [Pirellulales bacterium]|nr:PEP-CTERM sorting domain-containing protein [Pirellulales bacterium]